MKPFFFLVLVGLTGCSSLANDFEIDHPQNAIIHVTIQYPDGSRQTRSIPNFSRLESIWSQLTCDACDLRSLNPDQILKDGDVIVLRPIAGLTVSLNQATVEDLMFLPGIGEVLAQRIIPGGMALASGLILGFIFSSGALGLLYTGHLAELYGFPYVLTFTTGMVLVASPLALLRNEKR